MAKDDFFCHLRVYSEYSLKIGINHLPQLVAAAASDPGMSGLALTDLDHVFAAVKFYKQALSQHVHPIIGVDVLITHEDGKSGRVLMLCKNWAGFQALAKLLTSAQSNEEKKLPFSWLTKANTKDMIILSGAWKADWLRDEAHRDARLANWKALMGDRYYLEVQRLGQPNDEVNIQLTLEMAQLYDLPIVATNPVCFLASEDHEAHQARICINQSQLLSEAKNTVSDQCYFKSASTMRDLFHDLPDAIENAYYIGQRCACQLPIGQVNMPIYNHHQEEEVASIIQEKSAEGMANRVGESMTQTYHDRLAFELDIIKRMGFSSYFLIVADFISWAKKQGIPVGPGRGSGAGSMVAYALGITDLDPIQHGLLFERFLNPERVSMPDFDIDFCMDRRDQVIEYVASHYGRDHVAQIITYGTMAAKAVVRDVGRVLGMPYGMVDGLAKLIPFELGITLEKAIEQEPQLQARINQEPEVENLFNLARKLEGVVRNVGKHAGGVVIAPKAIDAFMPIYQDPASMQPVTQFDKDDVEAMGLVKFDFLGLRTLTIIDWTIQSLKSCFAEHKHLDINQIPLDDERTFEYLQTKASTAIFQLESRGMQELVFKLQPDRFEDLVALVALYRPGPLQSGMVDDFVDRKHGRSQITYLHDGLAPILDDTYGVILYQEQVMRIAQDLAGYTLGGADLLRRAMGKKKPEEMAKQRTIFLTGALEKNIPEKTAESIFDLMEKFAGYGFNKSHSAAYALLTYQTAWLKTHYPAYFMAAVLSADIDNTDKIMLLLKDCKKNALVVSAPCIQHSLVKFTAQDEKTIRYGLGAIKGVGQLLAEQIVEQRQSGPYQDLADFCQRMHKKVNRKALEALIGGGAMDDWGVERSRLMASIDKALAVADQTMLAQAQGQQDLFALAAEKPPAFDYVKASPWTMHHKLAIEKNSLGFYFSGHPIDQYQDELGHLALDAIFSEPLVKDKLYTIAGYPGGLRVVTGKKGGRLAFMQLEGMGGACDCAFFNDTYDQFAHWLKNDGLLILKGKASIDQYTQQIRLEVAQVMDIGHYRAEQRAMLVVDVAPSIATESVLILKSILAQHTGHNQVCFRVLLDDAPAKLMLKETCMLDDALLAALEVHQDVQNVAVIYPKGNQAKGS